jgi:hypothetical protein
MAAVGAAAVRRAAHRWLRLALAVLAATTVGVLFLTHFDGAGCANSQNLQLLPAPRNHTLLHLDPASGGNHSLAAGVVPGSSGAVPVRVTTLDAYLAGTAPHAPVDLLKVDVEGYDGYVLRGRLEPCDRDEVARYAERAVNLNLVAVHRREHLDIVAQYGRPSGTRLAPDRAGDRLNRVAMVETHGR